MFKECSVVHVYLIWIAYLDADYQGTFSKLLDNLVKLLFMELSTIFETHCVVFYLAP